MNRLRECLLSWNYPEVWISSDLMDDKFNIDSGDDFDDTWQQAITWYNVMSLHPYMNE